MTVLEIVRSAAVDADQGDRLDDIGLDSLELLDLQLSIESEFSIKIPDQDFAQLQTVGDLISITDKLRNSAA